MDIIVEERNANMAAIGLALEEIIAYARANGSVIKVIQFGSTVRGRIDALSDLDVLVVMESDKNFIERGADIRAALTAAADMDILCYRPDEIEAEKDRPFLRSILKEGKVIYEK